MEDVSAVDLDWYWHGWFYTTDNENVSLDKVRWFKVRQGSASPENKDVNAPKVDLMASADAKFENFDKGPEPLTVMPTQARMYGEFQNRVDDNALITKMQNKNFYEVTLSNKGGLVMPVIIEWTYKDGSKETDHIPAEIWRNNEFKISKIFAKEKEVALVTFDPLQETTDINVDDNTFPHVAQPSKFDELKKKN
jgi:hypothetical protein